MTRKGFIGSSFAFAGLAAACAATTWAGEVDLGGTWSLVRSDDPAVVYPAKVPGDVHSTLFDAGVIPDPHFGRNELKNLWVGEKEWTFSRTFELSPEFLKAKRVTLRLEDVAMLKADGTISGGMLPKIEGCERAIEAGVKKVHLVDGRMPHSLLLEIFTREGVGTEITE